MDGRHVVIVSPDPANQAGGVERMCELLARVLREDGWTATIVGPERTPGRWISQVGGAFLARSRSVTERARGLQPDLLVTNGYLGMGRSHGLPRVHVYHGTMVEDTRSEASTLPRRERFRRAVGGGAAEAVAGRGATVVCVSRAVAGEIRRFYRLGADAVIPNGIDTALFRPGSRAEARLELGLREGGRYCLFVGRPQYRKGADLLLDACREADFELLVAGPPGLAGAHELGVLGPDALARAYVAADCVLFPSRYEACSYVVLEALACAVPLLTTEVGWVSTLLDAVPEYRALCVRPDHRDIVTRLKNLEEIASEELTSSARAWVLEHNSLESYARAWRELLGSLDLDGGSPSSWPRAA